MLETILNHLDALSPLINGAAAIWVSIGLKQTIRALAQRVTHLEVRDENKEARLVALETRRAA